MRGQRRPGRGSRPPLDALSAGARTLLVGILSVGALLVVTFGLQGCGGDPPVEGALSWAEGRGRWRAQTVTARIDAVEAENEWAITLRATQGKTGETLTFFCLADQIEGTHEVKVFGRLAGVGSVAPDPVTNACSSSEPGETTGTLTIDEHDPERRLLSGSFLANVCSTTDPAAAVTLGDGQFETVGY